MSADSTPPYDLQQFERLLADLSARFVNLPPDEVDGAITDALRRIVQLLDVDRSQLMRMSSHGDALDITHSWAMDGVPAVTPKSIAEKFPWALRRLRAGLAVVVPRVGDLPPEAAVDRGSFQGVGVKSNLTMPMSVAGQVEGALAFGCLRRHRDWPEPLVARIRVLADVFANALAHRRAEEGLGAAMRFERLVSGVLTALLAAGPGEEGRIIEAGLRDVAGEFCAERATLWWRIGDRPEFTKIHRWVAEGAPRAPEAVGARATPWLSTQLAQGVIIRFESHADLPTAAAADLPELLSHHVRAGIVVPLAVSGTIVGALSFGAGHDHPAWPDALVPRVKLLGEVFAGVLARRQAERRAQEAQAHAAHAARVGTMGVFAASLVHELTQPLAASLANAETAADLLAARSPDLGELRATVADIVADERRAGELIQQLRRFLRRGEVERTELALREVADEVLRLAGAAATDKGVAIALDFAATLPKLVGDRVQLEQVLLNLLLNAVDAVAGNAPDARSVTLAARPSTAGVTIEVTDTGSGMDETTLARVFEPFFTTKPRGMGLGLAISRTIVSMHGGTLTVRSAPGRGATFRVELPVRPPAAAPLPQRAMAPALGTGTVYVIDDDPSMRRALERQLESAGYRVVPFASAGDYLDRQPVDDGAACIVSDVRMPGPSGLDLQAALARAARELPIVFVSGHGDVATTAHAMKAGAVNFLAKPFTKEALLAAVGEALAQERALDADRRERAELRHRYDSLTPREREVLALVTAGLLNKLIADRLGAAEATVKIHRGRVMEKMGAGSVADLVRMAERLGLQAAAAVG